MKQQIKPQNTRNRQTRQKTIPPPNSQIQIKRPRESNSTARKHTLSKIRRRKHTRRILRITTRDVQEHALHEDKNAAWVDDDSYCRNYPVDLWACGPAGEV